MLSASNAVVGDALALLLATISEVYCCYYVSFDEGHLHWFLAELQALHVNSTYQVYTVLVAIRPHSTALESHVNILVDATMRLRTSATCRDQVPRPT